MTASALTAAARTARILVTAAALASLVVASPAAASSRPTANVAAAGAPALVTAACVRGSAACPIRIRFAPGAYTAQARAVLTRQGMERWFVVRARAGQTMIVIVNGKGATGGEVHFPGGGQDGGPGGRIYDGSLPATGDYRIRVTESLMAEGWKGPVDVVVVIY